MIYGAPAPEQESNTVTTAMMASGFATEDTDVRITKRERRSRTPPWRGHTLYIAWLPRGRPVPGDERRRREWSMNIEDRRRENRRRRVVRVNEERRRGEGRRKADEYHRRIRIIRECLFCESVGA
jgi:hypothetical protein